MELSDNTITVLRNFAQINPNVVIDGGSTIKTMSEARNILSSAEVDFEFPQKIGFYDLGEFLNTLSLVDAPQLKFEPNHVTISDTAGLSRIKYHYSDPDILTTPSKEIIMPAPAVTFELTRDVLNRIKRASSVLGHTEMSVERSGSNLVSISVIDNNDPTSNAFTIDVPASSGDDQFRFVFSIANLKVVDGDYEVGISEKLISHFVNKDAGIEYWVALEKSSTYED